MKYQKFKETFKNNLVFNYNQVKVLDSNFHRQQLSKWVVEGKLVGLIKGFYIFPSLNLNENLLAFIANQIYKPSYISLEFALSFYNFIPEGVYLITSISSKKTTQFQTPIANFSYRSIKPQLMFGYKLQSFEYQGKKYNYSLAEPEKAILDYLYLNHQIKTLEDFQGLRWNKSEMLEKLDLERLNRYLEVFKNKALEKRVKVLLEYLKS